MESSDWIPILIGVGVMAAIIALTIVGSVMTRQRMNQGWGSLAQRTGLTFDQGRVLKNASVQGTYRGRPLRLWTYTVSHGKSSTRYTAIELTVQNPMGRSLALRREGALDALGKKLGLQDVEIGDPTFDQAFVVRSQPPEFARSVLGPDDMLRHALTQTSSLNVELKGSGLKHHQTGLETDADRLVARFDALCALADAVETATIGVAGGEKEDKWAEPVEEAPAEEAPIFASDALPTPAEEAPADPFWGRTPMPDSSYPYGPSDPFARPQTGANLRTLLIAGFVLLDLLVMAAIVAWLLLRGA